MRLSEFEIESIKRLAIHHFGTDVKVFLFGSRISDQKHGGDIDLFISKRDGGYLNIRSKIEFQADLIFAIGDQRIDVVLENQGMINTVFFNTINQTGIQLC